MEGVQAVAIYGACIIGILVGVLVVNALVRHHRHRRAERTQDIRITRDDR